VTIQTPRKHASGLVRPSSAARSCLRPTAASGYRGADDCFHPRAGTEPAIALATQGASASGDAGRVLLRENASLVLITTLRSLWRALDHAVSNGDGAAISGARREAEPPDRVGRWSPVPDLPADFPSRPRLRTSRFCGCWTILVRSDDVTSSAGLSPNDVFRGQFASSLPTPTTRLSGCASRGDGLCDLGSQRCRSRLSSAPVASTNSIRLVARVPRSSIGAEYASVAPEPEPSGLEPGSHYAGTT
jgi:hypothetical protein